MEILNDCSFSQLDKNSLGKEGYIGNHLTFINEGLLDISEKSL